jgi:protein involved in polysaccharide export with SLBB domain
MNIRYYKILLTFIALIICQPLLANSLPEVFFQEDPSLLKQYKQTTENKQTTETLKKPISINQNTPNLSYYENLNNTADNTRGIIDKKSLVNRYFKALTGQSLNIYGSNEFNQPQNNELLFFNTIGKNYKLAPGDVIQVTITGLSSSNGTYQVMNDGTITLENIYPLMVNNMTLDQVNESILDKIKFDDVSAEVFVRLDTARLVTVQISGNVNSPRTIAVPAYTPLSRVIAYSGGVAESGSLRNIILSHLGEKSQTVDFYDFLQYPSSVNDPLIKSGARIFVPNIGATIASTGFVNNPGIYELPSDKSETTINDLLDMTGTSFLPFGATLKVSYIDSTGQIATRLVRRNDLIKEGEALNVEFIETRDLNISKIYGAVLKDYEIKTNVPLSIKEVIKNGAVLSPDIYRSFALIIGKNVQAINLNNALEEDSFTLPVGSDLLLFTRQQYLTLVAQDTNKSPSVLSTELAKAKNIAEIYLDGVRVAIVPVNHNQALNKVVKNYYVPGPKTIFDVALIENNSVIHAVDLKTEISKQGQRKLNKGDRLFIFEDKFYDAILKEIILERKMEANPITPTATPTTSDNTDVILLQKKIQDEKEEYIEAVSYSKRILQRANLINIKIDGKLFTYLPYVEGISSSYILEKLRNRLPKLVSEFAVIQNINTGKTPEVKNLNNSFAISQGEELNLISNKNYRTAIKNYDNGTELDLLTELKSSNAVKVYYDGKLVLLLPPNYRPSELKLFEQYTKNSDLYKLYVGLDTTSIENSTWNLLTFGSEEFFSDTNNLILGPSDVVSLFSNNFIRNEFINDTENINGVNFNINANSDFKENSVNNEQDVPILNSIEAQALGAQKEKSTSINKGRLDTHIEIMRNSLRTISGSVQFPGAYPVAKKIHLSSFLSTAGLIEQTSKSEINITEAINQEDSLAKVNLKNIKINDVNLNKVVLSGNISFRYTAINK